MFTASTRWPIPDDAAQSATRNEITSEIDSAPPEAWVIASSCWMRRFLASSGIAPPMSSTHAWMSSGSPTKP